MQLQAMAPLQERVRERDLWAAHLDPELGGQGFGQVKLGLMHEILGTSPLAPFAFGNQAPDSGNSEIIALAGTDEQKERYLYPLLAGGWVAVSGAGAVDGSEDAVRSMATEVKGDGATLVFDGRLAWDAVHVPGTWSRALAGEDVAPPLFGRGPVVEEPLNR